MWFESFIFMLLTVVFAPSLCFAILISSFDFLLIFIKIFSAPGGKQDNLDFTPYVLHSEQQNETIDDIK